MLTPAEGYIKYKMQFDEVALDAGIVSNEIILFRNTLAHQQLIGVYPDGVGFGNISEISPTGNSFIISGTQTGSIKTATAKDFCVVTEYDISKNFLRCRGLIKASSEALTHAAFYSADNNIRAVIHVHHFQLWEKLLQTVPTTNKDVPYGTTEMAGEVTKLLHTQDAMEKKIIVTAGHPEGIFTFGEYLQQAYDVLMSYVQSTHY